MSVNEDIEELVELIKMARRLMDDVNDELNVGNLTYAENCISELDPLLDEIKEYRDAINLKVSDTERDIKQLQSEYKKMMQRFNKLAASF